MEEMLEQNSSLNVFWGHHKELTKQHRATETRENGNREIPKDLLKNSQRKV